MQDIYSPLNLDALLEKKNSGVSLSFPKTSQCNSSSNSS